jgi:hypothetical protein
MTDQTYDSTATGSASLGAGASPGSTAEVAKNQARSVAEDAKQGGQQVAAAAKDQTRQVAGEAKDQAQQLLQQVRGEAADQASAQQRRAASGLRSLGAELASMAEQSSGTGVAADLARQASEQARTAASWLDSREPGDVVSELTDFARRRPGTFLAVAAAVGFLGGRLTRGLAAGSSDDQSGPTPATDSPRPEPLETPAEPAASSTALAPPPPQHGLTSDTLGEPQVAGMRGRP